MKTILACILTTLFIFKAQASGIEGLNRNQIDDLNICLAKKGLTYTQVNLWENQIYRGEDADLRHPLFHNFNQFSDRGYNHYEADEENLDNRIFVSGLFNISGRHSFRNAIISNMTFIGDFSELDFEGACLVNVRFYEAGVIDTFKIRHQANYAKNITY